MTIVVFSANDHSVVCYHDRFVFVGAFKKVVTNPATNRCLRLAKCDVHSNAEYKKASLLCHVNLEQNNFYDCEHPHHLVFLNKRNQLSR